MFNDDPELGLWIAFSLQYLSAYSETWLKS